MDSGQWTVDSEGEGSRAAASPLVASDFRQLVARGSLYETEHWILRAESRGLIEQGTNNRVNEAGKALNGLIRKPT